MGRRVVVVALVCGLGCGSRGPTEVRLGETSLIVWVNPRVNEANRAMLAMPGGARAGVTVRLGDVSATTDAAGVAVLSPVASGAQELRLEAGGAAATVGLTLVAKELRELAIAFDGSTARVMADLPYRFGGDVVEVTPSMTLAELNTALTGSNRIVLLRGGEYVGNLDFTGSDVTLFGEGTGGGTVIVRGDVNVSGSANRIRGARIVGTLQVDGSNFGLTSSAVTGPATIRGSSAVLLDNALCGGVTLSGSDDTVLENAALDPLPAPEDGC